MQLQDPSSTYKYLIEKHETDLKKLLDKRYALGWARFLTFIATVFVGWQIFIASERAGIVSILIGLAALIYFVLKDVDNNQEITNTKTLIGINRDELLQLSHDYSQRYDGANYAPADHDYANDLDLFGKASLYQWTNRCFTEQGRNLLADNFLHALDVGEIIERQEAIEEISGEVEWRQQLQAFAMHKTITTDTESKTISWINREEKNFAAPVWKIVVELYTIFALASVAACIFGYISFIQLSGLTVFYFLISGLMTRSTIDSYKHLSGIVKEIDILHELVDWIERKEFTSPLFNRLRSQMHEKNKAAAEIKELKKILDRFDLLLNMAGVLFLNPFSLWAVRQALSLHQWRSKNKSFVKKWFETIAEMEVLNSLATIHYNQPGWCFPKFSQEYFTFHATELGHPLIAARNCVTNDFELHGTGKISLVTGSNMAGKSTFLRSLGVNIVLAQMGAPVFAKIFSLSPVRLMSSMRIADNLSENTSTFYAELKKLKTIIQTVNKHERVFILLDEILRGTNSFDRHTGSEALIAQLIRENAVAVIATHDVELAKLEQHHAGSIANYHFDVQVKGEELEFDYKLKHGICRSMNASILMKKIGIQLD